MTLQLTSYWSGGQTGPALDRLPATGRLGHPKILVVRSAVYHIEHDDQSLGLGCQIQALLHIGTRQKQPKIFLSSR
jgi:hypothetical protein